MTRWTRIAALVLAGWTIPSILAAQTKQPMSEQDRAAIEQVAAAGGRGRLVAAVETRTTPGRPYSAEAVTESLQLLGDGNRIVKKSTTRVYRDNDGRTRREQIGADGLPLSITITDPVGGASFALNPATKIALQSGVRTLGGTFTYMGTGTGTGTGTGRGGGGGRGGAVARPKIAETTEAQKATVEKMRAANVEMAETSRDAAGQMKQVLERAASGGGTTVKEDLGEQLIEGVRATGTRSLTTIPAGAIGNLHEIKILSEQWFSPDLEVLVLTKHSDPRVGETVYKLTNIVRGQPDPNLFVVPPDYTVKARNSRSPE